LNLDEYSKENLWQLIVETVHMSVMYPTHKAYTRNKILPETPEITPKELALQLNMPLAEGLVILSELAEEQKMPPAGS
jgi:predicted nuclease of restriction endonuclease-like RecB superfamily